VNGNTIDLNKPISPTDKTLISQLNFRSEIQKYYIFIINYHRVLSLCTIKAPYALRQFPAVSIMPASTVWPQQWANPNTTRQTYAHDYYYLVDFRANPTLVSPYLVTPVVRDHMGGRQILYNNSPDAPQLYNTTSTVMPRSLLLPPMIQSRTGYARPASSRPKQPSSKWNGRFHPYSGPHRDDRK